MRAWPTEVVIHPGSGPFRAVVAGLGAVRSALAAQLADQGIERPMVVCGAQVARSPSLAIVLDSLGDRDIPVFDGSRPHTPVESVNAGAAAARACGADALLAVGGGSTMDCARGIARLLREGLDDLAAVAPAEWGGLARGGAAAPGRPPLPILCVGTTLSFAEFLPFFGARHAAVARKRPYSEAGTASRTVFLDGEVAAHTPVGLWRETGVKALDDALSAFCRAGAPEPFADPVLTAAMGELARALLASREAGDAGGAAARQHAFTAVWMTKASLPRLAPFAVPAWFSTAARHSLGAVLELPHGVGSCVALVPGLRFQLDATGAREHELHASVAWPPAVRRDALIETVAALLDALAVPTRLGAVVDGDPRLDEVATAMCEEAPALGPPSAVRRVCDEMV